MGSDWTPGQEPAETSQSDMDYSRYGTTLHDPGKQPPPLEEQCKRTASVSQGCEHASIPITAGWNCSHTSKANDCEEGGTLLVVTSGTSLDDKVRAGPGEAGPIKLGRVVKLVQVH